MHPRTVQRALGDEGLAFAEILDCVRRERARGLLTGTDVPFAEVSARLGFAEPAVLTRCARRWWGQTPSQVRSSTARR
jgi:AraC-like DNA-binding protein